MANFLFQRVTPNQLTLVRILIIPVLLFFIFLDTPGFQFLALALFFIACLTDFWDGHLARYSDQVSRLGKLLDPIADKMLISSLLIMLVAVGHAPVVPTILILMREFAVSGMRQVASAEGIVIPALNSAKWKTFLQMLAIGFLLVSHDPLSLPIGLTGKILLWIAMGWTVWTGFQYFREYYKAVNPD